MRREIAETLVEHNRRFYAAAGREFAATRTRMQPGMTRVLDAIVSRLGRSCSMLDIGCGNGRVAADLARRGHGGSYIGVDRDADLLALAAAGPRPERAAFVRHDITTAIWHESFAFPFDAAVAFAVIQHVPGYDARRALLARVRTLVEDDGCFAFSTWNLSASARMQQRIVPWRTIGLGDADVEEGDVLVEWRRGVLASRYVHEFTATEIEALRLAAGFERLDAFDADGNAGRLGHYELWTPA